MHPGHISRSPLVPASVHTLRVAASLARRLAKAAKDGRLETGEAGATDATDEDLSYDAMARIRSSALPRGLSETTSSVRHAQYY